MRVQCYLSFVPLWTGGLSEATNTGACGAAGKTQMCLCFSDKAKRERLIYSQHVHNNHKSFFKIQIHIIWIHSKRIISCVATATAEDR